MKLDESGRSLVEVIASIVIISIVLLSFFQLLIRSNTNAIYNNEKLVTIDLAETVLERLRMENHIVKESTGPQIALDQINLDGLTTKKINSNQSIYIMEMNNQTYQVEAFIKPSDEEHTKLNMKLVVVKVSRVKLTTNGNFVTVQTSTGNSEIEGFVKI